MQSEPEFKKQAVESVNRMSTSPETKSLRDLKKELKRALQLAEASLVEAQKKALTYQLEHKIGKRGSKQRARDMWNANKAFQFLGPAPKRQMGFDSVHRKLTKMVARVRRVSVIVRPHSGPGSGRCSRDTGSLGYMNKASAGGTLNLCPKFFIVQAIESGAGVEKKRNGEARQAGAIAHEICHSLGVVGKTHKQLAGERNAVMFRTMREWAAGNPSKARRNPSSYEAMVTFLALERVRLGG